MRTALGDAPMALRSQHLAHPVFIVGDRGSVPLKSASRGSYMRMLPGDVGMAGTTRDCLHWARRSGDMVSIVRDRQSVSTHLGRDQGRETALLDEAHLDGCQSISTNCSPGVFFGSATHLAGKMMGEMGSTVRAVEELRDSPDGAKTPTSELPQLST
jgi:hypothetical protein